MDNNSLKSQSLENILTSYNLLILFFVIFICLLLFMLNKNPKGFNAAFGYQIFITTPILLLFAFLLKELFQLKQNPQDSFLSRFNEPWVIPFTILITAIIGIIGLFTMLYVGGIFSDNPPENNSAMILNFAVIIGFIIVAGFIYKVNKDKDDNILKSFSKTVQDAFLLRTRYTVLLGLFILFVTIMYFVNPYGIMTNYGGPILFFSLFVGIVCAMLIIVYQKYLSNTGESSRMNEVPSGLQFLIKGSYILIALLVSTGLIYGSLHLMGVFEQDASKPESWGHMLFNLIMFLSMLGIVYKLANAGGFLDKNPLYRLILNTLLYIPCIFVSSINSIGQLIGFINKEQQNGTFSPPTPFEKKMLLVSLLLLGGYFTWNFFLRSFIVSTYLKQGGRQFINQPIPIDQLTNVSSYQKMTGTDKIDYRYAISFWFYLDSFPPSTSSSYLKAVPILSYGDNPAINYSSETNTLYVTVKQDEDEREHVENTKVVEEFTSETIQTWKNNITEAIEQVKTMSFDIEKDAQGNRILYKHPNVLLQKWNHIVLNYNGGTLDVFYNGKLVKSAIKVVPYMKYDNLTVGSNGGVKGNIANLMYFKMPLDILTIHTLYNSLKDKNPPVISGNTKSLLTTEN